MGTAGICWTGQGLDLISFYVQHKNNTEDAILVPMCLPFSAMERFQQELERITTDGPPKFSVLGSTFGLGFSFVVILEAHLLFCIFCVFGL